MTSTARPLRNAEPAKIIGWLLLAGWGLFALAGYAVSGEPFGLVLGTGCLGTLAGFVYAHRHPDTGFARMWVGLFAGLLLLAGVAAKLLTSYPGVPE